MSELQAKLIEYGFSDKEANVYLAMLELGPASAIDIAKKAGVNRATTYVMIESLKRRGLMSSVERGKKAYFVAESPKHLLEITKDEVQKAQTKHQNLEALMPEFAALFHAVDDKPRVRFFEGDEGLSAGRELIAELMKNVPQLDVFIHYDHAMEQVARAEHARRKILYEIGEIRLLYSIDEGISLPNFPRHVTMRKISSALAPFSGETNISDTVIMLAIAGPRPMLVIIESKEFARLFRCMFAMAWLQAEEVSQK